MNDKNKVGRPLKDSKSFAKILRNLIGNAPIKKIAEDVGVSRQTISNMLSGRFNPNILLLEKFADYFEVSTDYLLGRTPVKSPNVRSDDIYEYTGLTEEAADVLANLNQMSENIEEQ